MLRARAAGIGAWEKYALCKNASGSYSILSLFNKQWVSAELAYKDADAGMLRARAGVVDIWEKFNIYPPFTGPGTYSWQCDYSRDYVSAETDFRGDRHGMLRARPTTDRSLEQVQIVHAP